MALARTDIVSGWSYSALWWRLVSLRTLEGMGVETMRRVLLVLVALCLGLTEGADARTWYVSVDGWGDAPTIQAAIDSTLPGDEVIVSAGTYTWANQNASDGAMLRLKSGIWLRSEQGPEVAILDSQGQGIVISCDDIDSQTIIEGFTITGGAAAGAAGIHCENESYVVITNNVIEGNSPGIYSWSSYPVVAGNTIRGNGGELGGGIHCWYGAPRIIDNLIIDNTASSGGGIYCFNCDPMIARNTISSNEASYGGGGVYLSAGAAASITRNRFTQNRALRGGGVFCSNSSEGKIQSNEFTRNAATTEGGAVACVYSAPIISSNTIAFSVSASGAAIHCGLQSNPDIFQNIVCWSSGSEAIGWVEASNPTITCNDLWDNTDGNSIGTVDEGNISLDPLFCDAKGSDDYFLRSGSPCDSANNSCGLLMGALEVGCEASSQASLLAVGASRSYPNGPSSVARSSQTGVPTGGWDVGGVTSAAARKVIDSEAVAPGRPFHIGGTPRFGKAYSSHQGSPDGAFAGEYYLVVWEDMRNGSRDIYCSPVSTSGSVLAQDGAAVAVSDDSQCDPAIAYGGDSFVAVWQDWRMGSADIYGSRLNSAGEVLDRTPIAISSESVWQGCVDIACGRGEYLVVWQQWGLDSWDIYGARVSSQGKLLDANALAISTGSGNQRRPQVAFNGTEYFVVWEDGRNGLCDVYGARVSGSGEVIDPEGIALSVSDYVQGGPTVAYAGDGYLVVWHSWGAEGSRILGTRMTSTGEVLDPEGIEISAPETGIFDANPAVGARRGRYTVAWSRRNESSRQLYWAGLSGMSAILHDAPVALPMGGSLFGACKVVCDYRQSMVLACDGRPGCRNIYGVRVRPVGKILDPDLLPISAPSNRQSSPDVSGNGRDYFAVWQGRFSGSWNIYGARVDSTGAVLDPRRIVISDRESHEQDPAVAFDGKKYFVVWVGADSVVMGARVTSSGEVLDTPGIRINTHPSAKWRPAVEFDGNGFLVVWEDPRGGSLDIYGARVDTSGKVLDLGGIGICKADGAQRHPALAFDGTSFMVIWSDNRHLLDINELYGARVTRDGEVLDPEGIPIVRRLEEGNRLSDLADEVLCPAIGFDGANYLVVWDGSGGRRRDLNIYGILMGTEGDVLSSSPISISTSAGSQRYPSVVLDGKEYVVVWQDGREGSENLNIYGCRVTPSGEVTDGDGIVFAAAEHNQVLPAAAVGDSGEILTVYSSYTTPPKFGSSRIFGSLRQFQEDVPPRLTLGIHQNPEVTDEVSIYLLPSEPLRVESVWMAANVESLAVAPLDTLTRIYTYVANYHLSGPGDVSVSAGARDIWGNQSEVSRVLGVGLIEADRGGEVVGPHGIASLRCEPHSVSSDNYILITTEEVMDSSSGDSVEVIFELSPASLSLRRRIELRLNLSEVKVTDNRNRSSRDFAIRNSNLWPTLWREGPDAWEEVDSSYDAETGILSALVDRLGRYRAAWQSFQGATPQVGLLMRNIPNPFSSRIEIHYHLPSSGEVNLVVFDAAGRVVEQLYEGKREPGWHSEVWEGKNSNGFSVASGVYFLKLSWGSREISSKCLYIK